MRSKTNPEAILSVIIVSLPLIVYPFQITWAQQQPSQSITKPIATTKPELDQQNERLEDLQKRLPSFSPIRPSPSSPSPAPNKLPSIVWYVQNNGTGIAPRPVGNYPLNTAEDLIFIVFANPDSNYSSLKISYSVNGKCVVTLDNSIYTSFFTSYIPSDPSNYQTEPSYAPGIFGHIDYLVFSSTSLNSARNSSCKIYIYNAHKYIEGKFSPLSISVSATINGIETGNGPTSYHSEVMGFLY